jgi:hypothetical protein
MRLIMQTTPFGLGSYLLALTLTIVIASGATFACYDYMSAWYTDGSGSVSCSLSGSDANYCYYNCECSGTFSQCDDLLAALGFEVY